MKIFKLDQKKLTVGLTLSIIFLLSACQVENEVGTNKYEKFLSQAHAQGQFNGNALILEDGKIAFQGFFGIGNIEPVDSLNLHSIFRLGSVSKQFTAMGIMKLKESGQLSYDQDIKDVIPELPFDGVTIRHLLNHVSGLPDYMVMMDKNWKTELEDDNLEKFVSGNIDLIEMFAKIKPQIHFEPGEKWEYSNTGYVLLASIVSRVSGIPFEQFLKEQIFDPAKMTSTSVYNYVPGSDPQMLLRVYGYRAELNGIDLVSTDIHYLNPVAGDGGVYSTLEDLLKWDRILYTNELISEDSREEAFTPAILNNGDTTSYGFGWSINKSPTGKNVVQHGGAWVGFQTYIYREIEENNCIIILTNNSSNYLQAILGPLKSILHNQSYELPKTGVSEVIGKIIATEGVNIAIEKYSILKAQNNQEFDFREFQLVGLGFDLIQLDQAEDAIKILSLNQKEYPQNIWTLYLLGNAYLEVGDTTNALSNYKKTLSIDSTFSQAIEKIISIN